MRCFVNWLVDADYIEQSPFRGLKNIRLPQRIVQPFGTHEIRALLAACGDSPLGLRDRAMILTLLDSGLRCLEAVQLELADLDLEGGRVLVRSGKGTKQRVVPFAAMCRAADTAANNAMMESFFGTMQLELLDRRRWDTPRQLASAGFEWIEAWRVCARSPRSLWHARLLNLWSNLVSRGGSCVEPELETS